MNIGDKSISPNAFYIVYIFHAILNKERSVMVLGKTPAVRRIGFVPNTIKKMFIISFH